MAASTNRKSWKDTNHGFIESEIFFGSLDTKSPFDLEFQGRNNYEEVCPKAEEDEEIKRIYLQPLEEGRVSLYISTRNVVNVMINAFFFFFFLYFFLSLVIGLSIFFLHLMLMFRLLFFLPYLVPQLFLDLVNLIIF